MTAPMGAVEQPKERVPRVALVLIAGNERKKASGYEQLLGLGGWKSGRYRIEE